MSSEYSSSCSLVTVLFLSSSSAHSSFIFLMMNMIVYIRKNCSDGEAQVLSGKRMLPT